MMDKSVKDKFSTTLRALYRRANALSRGSLEVLRWAILSFGEARAPEAAASMAFFTIFSLFPLLLVLISVGSFVLETSRAQQAVLVYLVNVFPFSRSVIEDNIRQVLALRGPVGIAGLIGLFWAAAGVFNTLAHNINRAWREARGRGFLQRQLIGVGIVAILALLLALSFVTTTFLGLVPRLGLPLWDLLVGYGTAAWHFVSNFVPTLFTFLLFLNLYRWIPNTQVGWRPALVGSLVAVILWTLFKRLFAWYLNIGLVYYEVIYGSLATIIVLLIWTYVVSLIALFGAHLSAAIAYRTYPAASADDQPERGSLAL
jgi:membrane protein